jgi:hypothetical protein
VMTGHQQELLKKCASAIPSYVEDLSRCYGSMVEARALLARIAKMQPNLGYPDPLNVIAQLVADARAIVDAPVVDAPLAQRERFETCESCNGTGCGNGDNGICDNCGGHGNVRELP